MKWTGYETDCAALAGAIEVSAYGTTRDGGVSLPPYDTLNLGVHVGDDPARVTANRARLCQTLDLPTPPVWLDQIHGTRVLTLAAGNTDYDVRADAAYTRTPGQVCAVMTADCLPVLFTCDEGNEVAAAHAGWRGLCNGVLEQTLSCFNAAPGAVMVCLGRPLALMLLKWDPRYGRSLSSTIGPASARSGLLRTVNTWPISTPRHASACRPRALPASAVVSSVR